MKYEYCILEKRNVINLHDIINILAGDGWRCVNLVYASGMYVVLMEREVVDGA